ncbi:MAG TPA: GNAT family N-acetyltransferase [Polyangiaceae bacterium]
MYDVRRLDVQEFASRVVPFLAEREVEYNLLIGISARLAEQPEDARGAVFAAVEAGGRLVGAVLRTPPQLPIVTRLEPGAARAVARFLASVGDVPDGAIAPEEHGRELARALAELRGGNVELTSDEIVYELTEVRRPRQPSGFARPAAPEDAAIVQEFVAHFFREVELPHPPPPEVLTERILREQTALLWDDGGVRSLACRARYTTTGAAIAPVYTPPEARGRGYASAVTAELCERLLGAGRRFVCLHAERSNPVSNRIYRAIGFREVSTNRVWTLR